MDEAQTGGRFLIVATDAADPRSHELIRRLDDEMYERYRPGQSGEDATVSEARMAALQVHADEAVAVLLALDDLTGDAVGHVILRRLDIGEGGMDWELKRLYVDPAARGRGIARALADDVVRRAREDGASRVILQTGAAQPESLALYRSMGFTPIPVYEPYRDTMPNSLCFELALRPLPLRPMPL